MALCGSGRFRLRVPGALNFHFVGDVIAGAMLGSVTGVYATRLFGLDLPYQSKIFFKE